MGDIKMFNHAHSLETIDISKVDVRNCANGSPAFVQMQNRRTPCWISIKNFSFNQLKKEKELVAGWYPKTLRDIQHKLCPPNEFIIDANFAIHPNARWVDKNLSVIDFQDPQLFLIGSWNIVCRPTYKTGLEGDYVEWSILYAKWDSFLDFEEHLPNPTDDEQEQDFQVISNLGSHEPRIVS